MQRARIAAIALIAATSVTGLATSGEAVQAAPPPTSAAGGTTSAAHSAIAQGVRQVSAALPSAAAPIAALARAESASAAAVVPAVSRKPAAPRKAVAAAPKPTGKVVYLTFDDGPDAATGPILDLLAAHNARATFFMLGMHAQAEPAMVERVLNEGHVIANHTRTHPDLTRRSDVEIRSQLSATETILGGTRCVRPPYGATSPRVKSIITSLGKSQVLWDIDPQDWARPGAATIAERVLAHIRPGANVLLHDGGGDRTQTVAAVRTILKALDARGFQVAPVPGC